MKHLDSPDSDDVRFHIPQNISGASQRNSLSLLSLNKWSRWGLVLKHKKNTTERQQKMAPYSSLDVIQVSGSPEIPDWQLIRHYLLRLCVKIVAVAVKLKALACNPSEVGASTQIRMNLFYGAAKYFDHKFNQISFSKKIWIMIYLFN